MLTIEFDPTNEARQARFIETGEAQTGLALVKIDASLLTEAARKILAPRINGGVADLTGAVGKYVYLPVLPGDGDIAGVEALVTAYAEVVKTFAEEAEKRRQEIQARDCAEAERICAQWRALAAQIRANPLERIYDRPWASNDLRFAFGPLIDAAKAEYDAAEAAAEPARRAEQERKQEEYRLAEAEREAEKARFEAERLEWIETYGSDHLRRAVKAGYNCQRRYVTERAALEFPGFVLDFDGQAEWKERSCPGEVALLCAEEHKGADARVVWLTNPLRHGEEYFEEHEAVLIPCFLGKYALLREF